MVQKELLGDKIEKVLKKVGAKKVAKAYERVTKKPCGCAKRKQALNAFHQNQINKAKSNRSKKRTVSARPSKNRQDTKPG